MNILWWSAAPTHHTGYARCAREVVPRLQEDYGYKMGIQCLSCIRERPIPWHGEFVNSDGEYEYVRELDDPITIYHSNSKFGLNEFEDNFEMFNGDLLFTHYDTWIDPANQMIPNSNIPYSSYIIVDHEPTPKKVIDQVSGAYETISMSKYAQRQLDKEGIRSTYIPHGVETDLYKPISDPPTAVEVGDMDTGDMRTLELDDVSMFFGMVATNHGDRKNIPNHMEAFKMFLDEIDNSALMYIHADQQAPEGYNLYQVQQQIGIPDENLIWGHPELYGQVGDETLNEWYNAMDVLINCSFGESWGLTITEAQSAQTPTIVTNHSSMPEQLGVESKDDLEVVSYESGYDLNQKIKNRTDAVKKAPHGVIVEPALPLWRERVSSKLYPVHPRSIFNAMRYYYDNPDEIETDGKQAREWVIDNYDWENEVVPKFDEVFSQLEMVLG